MLTPRHTVAMFQPRWLLPFVCVFTLGLMHPGMVNAAVDLDALTPVDTTLVETQVSYRSFNRRSGAMTYTATLSNVSAETVQGPLYLAIESITAAGVTVTNADDASTTGTPLLQFEALAPGESRSRSIVFSNPGRARFQFVTTVYGPADQDDTPPLITAIVSPAANPAGWHNTDVTVSFDCSDTDSGIASCTGPVTVTTEGEDQTVNGTAQDNDGNTAEASATLNIDKTPPAIIIDTPEEGASLGSDEVTVSGSSSDALSGIATLTCNGTPAILENSSFSCDLSLPDGGQSITVEATDAADNTAASTVAVIVNDIPVVQITAPATLSLFNSSPVTVSGSIDNDTATVSVNGIPATVTGGSFEATVPLSEGNNVLTAVATNPAGNVGTASIQVTLDTNAPAVTIDSPEDGLVTSATSITVTGMINDIVTGTVNATQAQVTVNGIPAQVANRSFLATGVPLTPGINIVTAQGTDQAGNSAAESILVNSAAPNGQARIEVISGDGQSGLIGTALAEQLVVRLTDAAGAPASGKTVIFKVVQNNGTLDTPVAIADTGRSLALATDADGQAAVNWTLGSRAGAGNNRVEASAVRFEGTAAFAATALSGLPNKINVDSGNNQVGVADAPLPLPFAAIVTDAGHNRLSGIPVTYSVEKGTGHFDGQTSVTATTDSDGRVSPVFTLGAHEGVGDNLVIASLPGNPDLLGANFVASGRIPGDPADTIVSGVVLDNTDNPIAGVTLSIHGTVLQTQSDVQGQFSLQPAPVGHVELIADGSTTQRPGTWPTLEFELTTVSGNDNTLGMPVYLLPLDQSNALHVDETHGGILELPDLPGFSLTVEPGTVTFPDGSRSGEISVTVVHADKIPMVPNFGQQPRVIVTIQPPGMLIDPPARLTIPNLDGLAPGEITDLYSFDHDLGQFVGIGTGSVSEDGTVVVSDPGVGIIKGGWHCGSNPARRGCCGSCGECMSTTTPCDQDMKCVNDDSKDPGHCLKCKDGVRLIADEEENLHDFPRCHRCKLGQILKDVSFNLPDEIIDGVDGDCKKLICNPAPEGQVVLDIPDVSDRPTDSIRNCRNFTCNPDGTIGPMGIDEIDFPDDPRPHDCHRLECDVNGNEIDVIFTFDKPPLTGALCLPFCTSEGTPTYILAPNIKQVPDDCRTMICIGDGLSTINDETDFPDDTLTPGDCVQSLCFGGNLSVVQKLDDHPFDTVPGDCQIPRCVAGTKLREVELVFSKDDRPFGSDPDFCVPP